MSPAFFLFSTGSVALVASVAGCIDPFGTYNGGSSSGGSIILPSDGGDNDGTTGTIIGGGGYDCSAQVAVPALLPGGCVEADSAELQVGTLSWVCAGGGAQISFGDFTLSGSVTNERATLSGYRVDTSGGDGQYELVNVSINLSTNSGQLTYERTLGAPSGSPVTICQATGTLTVQ